MSPAGRPRTGLGAEYQEVLALYEQGVRPAAIALYLGRPRSWVNSAVQSLRKRGAITGNVPTGRAPAPKTHVKTSMGSGVGGVTIETQELEHGEWCTTVTRMGEVLKTDRARRTPFDAGRRHEAEVALWASRGLRT